MPQMMPMYWLLIMIMVLTTLLLILNFIYFFLNYYIHSDPQFKHKQMNFKKKW